MCGIGGWFDPRATLPEHSVQPFADCLAHRGPDAAGLLREDPWLLCHRRLSILDLSAAAHQPFTSRCGRYVMVYNGEVYNFRELAEELGIERRTGSDTEVVIEGFARLGPRIFPELSGMFALAVLDRQEQRLYLGRDRLGIKPLYYFWDGRRLVFASELKALRLLPLPLSLDAHAVSGYLRFGFAPSPGTFYTGVRKLGPGEWGELHAGRWSLTPYWKPEWSLRPDYDSDQDALERLHEHLRAAVGEQLISDVPLGCLLSGGIDSSLITALAQSQAEQPLRTFTVSMRGGKLDEAPFARRVAHHLGTVHSEFEFSQTEAMGILPRITEIFDEPFGDSSGAPSLLISQAARRQVSVALCGDGGDELFLGYGAYRWAQRLRQPWLYALRRPLARCLAFGSDRWRRVGELLDIPEAAEFHQHIYAQEQYWFRSAEVSLLNPELLRPQAWEHTPMEASPRRLSGAEGQALFDLRYPLPDDLLTKMDRASMACSLEVRVPFLDHRVVEAALNLSLRVRWAGGEPKAVLRRLLDRYFPGPGWFDRPKWGFGIPLATWLAGPLRNLLDDYLEPGLIHRLGLVRAEPVQQLRRRFLQGERRLAQRLWLLIVLHKWSVEQDWGA